MDPQVTQQASYPASLILLTYNQQHCVEAAVQSALAQQCPSIEIILSDDASTDNTFAVLQDLAVKYTGPHHVVARQNTTNLGINPHLEHLVTCAQSDLIVWAAGDDISCPDRAQKIIDAHQATGAQLIFSDAHTQTENGAKGADAYKKALFYQDYTLKDSAASFALFLGATLATHKSLFLKYGSLPTERAHEDLILGFRAALEQSIHYIAEPLIYYQEDEGLTGTKTPLPKRQIILQGQRTVLIQRLKDAHTFGLIESDPVVRLLTKKIRWFESRLRYYTLSFSLSSADIYHPLQLAHAVMSEWLRDRKIRKRGQTDA
jgi:glycosyltransferase involved in cell wall biosynthesis